jgi:hypothetical protein
MPVNTMDYTIPSNPRENFKYLFELCKTSRVLVVGKALKKWNWGCLDVTYIDNLSEQQGINSYHMIFYHFGLSTDILLLRADLKKLKAISKHGRSIAIFCDDDRKSSHFIEWFHNYTRIQINYNTLHVFKKARSEILNVGLHIKNTFFSLQPTSSSEEFFNYFYNSSGRNHDTENNVVKTAKCYLFCVIPNAIEKSQLFNLIQRQVSINQHPENANLTFDQFALRQRGALIIFTSIPSNKQYYVSRVVPNGFIEQIVCRNYEFLIFLHNCVSLPTDIKRKLPNPIGKDYIDKSSVFTESRLTGELAWLQCKGEFKDIIYQQSLDFLNSIHQALGNRVTLSNTHLDRLFSSDSASIYEYEDKYPVLVQLTHELVNRLKQQLYGVEAILSVSHGDFGYGNILIRPEDGTITGVIDWDTGRREELAEIDHLNLLIQRYRIETNSGFYQAFKYLFNEHIMNITKWRHDKKAQFKFLGNTAIETSFGTMLVRYISRATSYREVFISEHDDFLKSMKLILTVVNV